MDSSLALDQGFQGLRCVRISRCQTGFGFTLRHFIVYPPELYSDDGDVDRCTNGVGQSRLHKVTEPVDTIFVKSVRENSPAEFAGLCVGDRIVSVNGETIVGKSYDQVVSLIQKTSVLLCLEVSPKQYDTLQLFYEEQAYRPETNQRPYEPLPLKGTSSAEPIYHCPTSQTRFHPGNNTYQLHDYSYDNHSYDTTDYSRLNMSSSHSSHPPTQFFSHLPRPIPYKSSAVWTNSSERNGERPYTSTLSQSSKTVQRPQPQGYYPFNHSFDKSTLWKVRERDEPNSGAKSADSIFGESCGDSAVYRSPLRSESMECLSDINTTATTDLSWKKAGPGYRYSISTAKAPGTATSQPSDYRNTMVVTMSSTNTGHSSHYPYSNSYMSSGPDEVSSATANSLTGYENQIADRIRRSCEQKEEFLKRPNQPFPFGTFSAQQSPPFPKELYAQPQKFTKVPWPPANIMPSVTSIKQPLQSSVMDSRNVASRNDKRSKSNNVTVISVQHSGPDSLSSGSSCRPETSTSDSWSPVDRHSEGEIASEGHKLYSETDTSGRDAISPSNLVPPYEFPRNRLTVVGGRKLHCDPPPDWKPDLATLTGYQTSQSSMCVQDSTGTQFHETDVDVQNSTENVILRKREMEPESENERLVRRVSYLKATSSPIDMERKSTSPTSPVKSFDVMSCKSTFPSGGTGRRQSMANKLSTEFFPKGRIYRLKQFFEDRTQPTASLFKFYVDSPTSEYANFGPCKPEKPVDVSEIVRDGKVHFKIRIGENKRGTSNRSWRQGFAQVRRSGYLYLSKERLQKDLVTGSEEPVIISVSIRDGVLVEHAEDYTKRKNVLRIRTTFVPDDESNFPLSLANENPQNHLYLNSTLPPLTIELLLQTEDLNDLNNWLQCIQKQLENNNCNDDTSANSGKGVFFGSEFCPKSKSFLTSFLPSPGTPVLVTNPPERNSNTLSVGGSASNSLNPNSAVGVVNNAASPKVYKTWKGKVAKKCKKVHDIIYTSSTNTENKSSSPYASLPPAGATFGINLENFPPGESNPYVPRVIEYSIDLVEKRGIEMVGLYRIPGNNASIAILTESLNRGEDPNPEKDSRWLDVHVVASLIKSFLRRLPDPLLTNDGYSAFIQAANEDEETALAKIKDLIRGLPIHNYETLKAVVMHLKHVAEKGEINRMDARNLAIVFGPTIVRAAEENISSMVADMKNQCKIVEAFVLHADNLFTVDEIKPTPVVMRQHSREQRKSHAIPPVSPSRDLVTQAEASKPLSPASPIGTIENELKVSLIKAAKRKVSAKENQPVVVDNQVIQAHESAEPCRPVDDKGFIRSYAGLNEVTERRIRNFELETRAMLSRDDRSPNASLINVGASGVNKPIRGMDDIRQQKLKLDDAIKKAKDDLETEDIYDQIADNPSSIVHHRERGFGLSASSPGPFNLSNSSISSSNSNSTAPSSLLTSSLPAWPTSTRLGPTPFRNSMPPQSLPPKPPTLTPNSSFASSFDGVPANAQIQCPMRRVNSFDRLQGPQPVSTDVDDMSTIFDRPIPKGSFRRRNDGTLTSGTNPKQLGGSLDSLKDITTENCIMGNTRMRYTKTGTGTGGSRDDLSSRSSDGSDMVTALTKTLDKKLENLHTNFHEHETNSYQTSQQNAESHRQKNADIPESIKNFVELSLASISNQKISESCISNQNHFQKKARRRHSLIERRKSSFEGACTDVVIQSDDTQDHPSANSDSNKSRDNHSDVTKASKPASKKLAKECRRRHSLSGATDILSLVFRGSEKLSVHRDSDPKNNKNKTLSSEALLSALKNASILESHV